MDIVELITQTGGTLGLAVFAIWMLNRVWADRVAALERYATTLQGLHEQMRKTVERNTEALTRLTARLDER